MNKRRVLCRVCAIAVASALLLACLFWRPASVAYHCHRMESIRERIFSVPTAFAEGIVGFGDSELIERFEYHREKLVELRAWCFRCYEFQHISGNSDESEEILRRLGRMKGVQFGNYEGVDEDGQPFRLRVWDDRKKMTLWQAFVEAHDVSDFGQRYLQSTTADGQAATVR